MTSYTRVYLKYLKYLKLNKVIFVSFVLDLVQVDVLHSFVIIRLISHFIFVCGY
jgi:hypothetical protein